MTPKEKAKELMQKAYDLDQYNKTSQSRCKQIALLCVYQIIKAFNFPKYDGNPEFEINGDEIYWLDVKKELSLL